MTISQSQIFDKKKLAIKTQIEKVIPNKYLKFKCDNMERLNRNIGKSLYLFGTVGLGKSVFASHIADRYIHDNLKIVVYENAFTLTKNAKIKWSNYPELVSKMRSSFSRNAESNAWELAEEIADCKGLVVLDDFAAEHITGFIRDMTYYIINYREINEYQTIITSNVELSSIEDRISSRIAGMCEIIRFAGEDRRIK